MISLRQLQTFVENKGDFAVWIGSEDSNNETIPYTDWSKMDDLIQDFTIISNASASEVFKKEFDRKLKECFEDDETMKFFLSLLK